MCVGESCSFANWMARVPVAVLPPYMSSGNGCSAWWVGNGSFSDW